MQGTVLYRASSYCLKSTGKHYLIGVCNDGIYIIYIYIYTIVCEKIKGNIGCVFGIWTSQLGRVDTVNPQTITRI